MKKRSMSFFTKNLLLSAINIFLIGTILIAASYMIQRNVLVGQLHSQIKTVTSKWYSEINPAKVQEVMKEKNYDGPAHRELQVTLDLVNKYNPSIAQAYLFGTELTNGNQTSIIAMPTHVEKMFIDAKLMAGDMYEQPAEIARTVKRMLESGQPELSSFYTDDYGIWTSIVYPIKDSSGKISSYFAVDIDASAVSEGLNKLLLYGLSILIIFFVLIMSIQYIIVKNTLSPIRSLIGGIEKVSAGYLDVEIPIGKSDLGLINEKFNDMVRLMNQTMLKVQETSNQVAESAMELYTNSERSSESAGTINRNIREIAGSIQTQESSSAESSRAISEMASVIQMIASNTANVSDEAYAVERKSMQGDEVVKSMTTQMGLITDTVKSTSQAVNLLEERSQEIGSILEMITGISNQTNLLALNAAIEAARVGEHGRGFAVVAGEVRKLAEQSQSSANQISVLIQEIQSEIRSAAQAMDSGTKEVEKGRKVAEETGKLFSEILGATKKVSAQIQEVSAAAQQISAGTEEISATADALTHSVSKTAVNAGEITRSIDEQKQYMESIVDSSNKLSGMSSELKKLVQFFHVKK